MKDWKRVLAVAFLVLLVLPLAFAESFYIDNYYVDIEIEPSGKNHIYEVMDVVFTEPSHGIIRDIQYEFDGVSADVEDFQTNLILADTTHEVDNYVSYYLGDPEVTLTGPHKIKMKYDFTLHDDWNREYDEWYYNIVGTEFGTHINNVEFHVKFPYPADVDKIWVTSGYYGSTETDLDIFRVNDDSTEIYGKATGLGAHEAVTVRAEFPEGYFNLRKLKTDNSNLFGYIAMGAMLAMMVIAFILYRRHGVDDPIVPVVRFNAPDGMTPYDCAYLLDGAADFKSSVIAMLLYWADMGYVKVYDDGDEKNESFTFEKLCSLPDSAPKREKTFFRKVFRKGDLVNMEDLALLTVEGLSDIKHDEDLYFQKEEPLYEKKGDVASAVITVMSILVMPLMLLAGLGRGDMDYACFLFFPAIIQFLFNLALLRPHGNNGTRKHGIGGIFKLVFGIILNVLTGLVILVMLAISEYDINGFVGFLLPIIEVFAAIMLSLLSGSSRKRTEYATAVYGDLLGFRDFVEFAEKDRIKVLVDEDPEYFYHVLCYAIAFGQADAYMEKFKGLRMYDPSWYEGPDVVDYMYWSSFNRRYRRSYQYAMSKVAPRIESGGKSGRGSFSGSSGFSGGGFSGGGARSW